MKTVQGKDVGGGWGWGVDLPAGQRPGADTMVPMKESEQLPRGLRGWGRQKVLGYFGVVGHLLQVTGNARI